MFYRDFMQKYRPLWSPDEPAAPAPGGDAAAAVAGAEGQAAPAASAGPSAEPAAAAPAADATPAPSEAPKSEPSLLEAAEIKTPEPAAEAGKEGETKDAPAPAEAAKPEGDKPKADDVKDAKADDKPKAEGDKSAAETDPAKKDATAEAQPPAPIKYDAFKLPEGMKLDDERIGKFTEIAGAAQVSQEVAQSLVDLHVSEMQRYAEETRKAVEQHQRDVWNKLNDTWKTDARNDPQIGGNRLETALSRGKALIEEYGGTPEQVRELLAHTSNNGMGNYPGFLRLLDNLAEAMNVYEDLVVGANVTPPKGGGTRGERWYPSMANGAGPKA